MSGASCKKKRSSTSRRSKALVNYNEPPTAAIQTKNSFPSEFDGEPGSDDVIYWLQRLERYLIQRKFHEDDKLAADYMGTLMIGAAYHWFQTLPRATKTSFMLLKDAFTKRFDMSDAAYQSTANKLARFEKHLVPGLSVEEAQPSDTFWAWLDELHDLADQIAEDEVSPSTLVEKAWKALPAALQKEIGAPKQSVAQLVKACEDLPPKQYEKLMKETRELKALQDQMKALDKDLDRAERLARRSGATVPRRTRFAQRS